MVKEIKHQEHGLTALPVREPAVANASEETITTIRVEVAITKMERETAMMKSSRIKC